MIPTYVPLLKALKSEFEAIAKMRPAVRRKTRPLFEVGRIGKNIVEAKRFEGCQALTTAYLDEVADGIARVWSGRLAMVDAYQWPADSTVESGEHVLPYIYGRLESMGVRVIPVIGYDRWGNQTYRAAMEGVDVPEARSYCLRLDTNAIEDAAEPEFFEENIHSILTNLDLDPSKCSVLIDFGNVTGSSVEDLVSKTGAMLSLLRPYGFKYYATAGCSLPSSIDQAVKKPDSVGKVLRREMLLWQAMREDNPSMRLVYGDYGVRGPTTSEGVGYGNTNCKIRYTIGKNFFVARGHSISGPGKGAQMWGLADTVKNSQYYMGEAFSWGDKQIAKCSLEEFKGTAGTWITIDTSHHMAFVVAEVEEFELTVMTPTAKQTASS